MAVYKDIIDSIDKHDIAVEVAFQLLDDIIDIIREENFDDRECFHRIEAIIQTLNDRGICCGLRHDFSFMVD